MAEIYPFKGIRYNPEKISDMSLVVAPPYDVISPAEQEEYYAKSPYNIVRLILGKEFPTDSDTNNRYTRAAHFFTNWLENQVLIQDNEPSFYFYSQEFFLKDKRLVREGFFALIKLEEYRNGIIIPHERTLSAPKEDRFNLMCSCRANFSPIFLIYNDSGNKVLEKLKSEIKTKPLIEVKDEKGIVHRLWRLRGVELHKKIKESFNELPLIIADGHHRYETALRYRDECRKSRLKVTGREGFEYMMVYLTPFEGEGLVILPYHRVLHNLPGFDFYLFEKKVKETFEIETITFSYDEEKNACKFFLKRLEEKGRDGHAFGIFAHGVNAYYLLTIPDTQIERKEEFSLVNSLDVTILEKQVFEKILGIKSEHLKAQKNIGYIHDSEEAIRLVRDGGRQLAFLLNPPKKEEVRDIALRGETMPQKSTYFYPKLLSGLVINLLDQEEIG